MAADRRLGLDPRDPHQVRHRRLIAKTTFFKKQRFEGLGDLTPETLTRTRKMRFLKNEDETAYVSPHLVP